LAGRAACRRSGGRDRDPRAADGQPACGCARENRIELFDLARERAGDWPAESTVAVGDTPLDVSSAHAAGCHCVGVTTGNYEREALADADAVIADLGELETALAALS